MEKEECINVDGFTIDQGVFIKYDGLDRNVVIPEGITEIGGCAFLMCSSLP